MHESRKLENCVSQAKGSLTNAVMTSFCYTWQDKNYSVHFSNVEVGSEFLRQYESPTNTPPTHTHTLSPVSANENFLNSYHMFIGREIEFSRIICSFKSGVSTKKGNFLFFPRIQFFLDSSKPCIQCSSLTVVSFISITSFHFFFPDLSVNK